ncbi:MAG TPA: hypothetical protein VM680_17105 [Verrucomicrobiae bacterium]|nr:hypothetical protein [Verrucomicrobiae bacterium]
MKIETKSRRRGVALLIVLFMISFLLAFIGANSNALFGLKREIKLVEQKQNARWSDAGTNRVQELKK